MVNKIHARGQNTTVLLRTDQHWLDMVIDSEIRMLHSMTIEDSALRRKYVEYQYLRSRLTLDRAVTAVYKGSRTNTPPVLLRSYDSRREPPPEFECTIWQAGRATSATGLAFKPIQIGQSVFIPSFTRLG